MSKLQNYDTTSLDIIKGAEILEAQDLKDTIDKKKTIIVPEKKKRWWKFW